MHFTLECPIVLKLLLKVANLHEEMTRISAFAMMVALFCTRVYLVSCVCELSCKCVMKHYVNHE